MGGRRYAGPVRPNVDEAVVADFGREWQTYDQSGVPERELREQFERYFAVFPWGRLTADAVGFDAGCGSGRWARFVAPRVGRLHCIDASSAALAVARRSLAEITKCEFHEASLDDLPLAEHTMDFGYCLGVLHHVPDPEAALRSCVRTLRPNAPFLVYLYYDLADRGRLFRSLFGLADSARRRIARLPHRRKLGVTRVIAYGVYLPLARLARVGERLGRSVEAWPLSQYRDASIYTMRTDALDRFGTRLEQRFSRDEVVSMLERAGLGEIVVSPDPPYWCAVGVVPPNARPAAEE